MLFLLVKYIGEIYRKSTLQLFIYSSLSHHCYKITNDPRANNSINFMAIKTHQPNCNLELIKGPAVREIYPIKACRTLVSRIKTYTKAKP